jgi:hypothetical protein
MYREIFKPIYEKLSKPATSRGIPIDFHNCGRCEDFVGDMIDFGVRYWNPAQKENNILGLKEKYGNRIAICGGWDSAITEDASEEEAREAVRSHIDRFAKGGGFVFFGMVGSGCNMFAPPSEKQMRVNGWITDELYEYGSKFYQDPKNR